MTTLTIADRWRVTFGVQSLARVSLPPSAAVPTPQRAPDRAAQLRAREEVARDRERWETELFLSAMRRMS